MAGAIYPAARPQPRVGWRDLVLFVAFFLLLYGVMRAVPGMRAHFSPAQEMRIDLSPAALPGYVARSLIRMFVAFAASILFTLVYGYAAAYHRTAGRILVPLLDILQSVPVLGFLSVTVTGFMALFPGSVLGLECASIFAIFTSQAWNMTFSFYHSLRIIPRDLREAAVVYRLSWWQRFVKLEVPFSMIGLVWNGMMSFGGAWFFLAASEAITVLGNHFTLPGVGSYMAVAVERHDGRAIGWAIVTMILVVVLVDQLFWRPVVAWSQKFRFEQSASGTEPTSVVLDVIQRSALAACLEERVAAPLGRWIDGALLHAEQTATKHAVPASAVRAGRWLFGGLALIAVALLMVNGAGVVARISPVQVAQALYYGFLTLLRVAAMVVLATVVWTPIGVRIGFSPKLARIAQPLVQIGASFPANLLFPLVVVVFLALKVSMDWGSVLLIALGTQWYILFNVIAGAAAVPGDLRETALVFRLRGWTLWRTMILPAIFPAWVTGAITAAGGAWNASIVAEVASWGSHTLTAKGLGAYIAQATTVGDWPAIILGIAVMSGYVVLANRFVWKPLYALAEAKYRLD